jgi:hypothetical protein
VARSRWLPAAFTLLSALSALAQTAPITGFAGRYLDSTATSEYLLYPRNLRARRIKVAPERDRVYMIMGMSRFVGQRLSTFPSRLATEPMQTGAHEEKYLAFNEQFDAEAPSSGWPTVRSSTFERLTDFDWDDRGLTYLAYGFYGWGTLDQNFHVVFTNSTDLAPSVAIVSFRHGSSYYALVSDLASSVLYDVTNAASPSVVRLGPAFSHYAKTIDGHIAVNFGTNLVIHTPASLANGTAPVVTFTHPAGHSFRGVTTDGVNFYALEGSSSSPPPDLIHIIKPAGTAYADAVQVPVRSFGVLCGYGAGYLTAIRPGSATPTVALYRVDSAGLTLLNDTYFDGYYVGRNQQAGDAQQVTVNGQTYLFIAAFGLGDVFTLAAAQASAAADAPTLSEWSTIALIALLTVAAVLRLRA